MKRASKPERPSAKSRPASGGTRKWIPVRRHPTLDAALEHLGGRGFRVLAAHPAPGAADFREVDYTWPTAILLGTEETGVSVLLDARAATQGRTAVTAHFRNETTLLNAVRLLADMAGLRVIVADNALYVTLPANKQLFRPVGPPGALKRRAEPGM